MKKVVVFTDGGSRGNPGPAGAGWAIFDESGSELKRNSKFLGKQTNNWAEYEAVYLALKKAKALGLSGEKIEMRLDSNLVVEQLSGNWQVKEKTLWPQYMKIKNILVKDFKDISFVHIPREKNKEADALANEAMDKRQQ